MRLVLQPTPEGITQAVAVMATFGLLWVLHEPHHHHHERLQAAGRDVQLSLLPEPPAPTPTAQPPAAEPTHAEPKPRAASQPAAPTLRAASQQAAPRDPLPLPTAAASVVEPSSAPATGMLLISGATSPPVSESSRGSVEDAYAAALRQNVDARISVPDTAQYRLLRPSGATQVRFALDRVGNPSDVSVGHSSGSGILDRQAVSIVATGRYPPFPETAYAGESRHVFIVTIEFRS